MLFLGEIKENFAIETWKKKTEASLQSCWACRKVFRRQEASFNNRIALTNYSLLNSAFCVLELKMNEMKAIESDKTCWGFSN